MKKILSLVLTLTMVFSLAACGNSGTAESSTPEATSGPESSAASEENTPSSESAAPTEPVPEPEGFVLIEGGSFLMGSPDSEPWRSEDETQHTVTVSDFYISPYELTQAEYEAVMGENPSSFSGEDLPVETVSWLDTIAYCNARSEQEGLTPPPIP